MINTLVNNIEICQSQTEGEQDAQGGDPPIAPVLSSKEMELLSTLAVIASAKTHTERKKLNDRLIPCDASCAVLSDLLRASTGVRQKLNGTLQPDMAKIINGLEQRIRSEALSRQCQDA